MPPDPLKRLLDEANSAVQAPGGSVALPPSWKPRMVQTERGIEAVSSPAAPQDSTPGDEELLHMFAVDPARWRVDRFRRARWQSATGAWLESYRVSFVPAGGRSEEDTSELRDIVSRWAPRPRTDGYGSLALVVNLSDWQIGKGEGGGTAATAQRVVDLGAAVERRISELRCLGRDIGTLVVHGLGDLLEGCSEFYAMQTFSVDLDRRSQLKVTQRLIAELLRRWAPLAPELVIGAVAGNHGENRREGRAYTTFGDNDDLLAFEVVSDVLAGRSGFEHLRWTIPGDRLSFVHDVCGVAHGVAHGHQCRGSGADSVRKWWEGQSFGVLPLMHAQILAVGHRHHLHVQEYSQSGRTLMQAPAMDGGSQWFEESSGMSAPTGTLTYLCGSALSPRGWSDMQIL